MNGFFGVHIGHNASVALLDDLGKVVFAAEEERFSRKKMQGGFPVVTLKYLENNYNLPSNISIAQVNDLLFYYRILNLAIYGFLYGKSGPTISNSLRFMSKYLMKGKNNEQNTQIDKFYAGKKEYKKFKEFSKKFNYIKNYDHHRCHAASAYYPSGFKKALVVTLDGRGDGYSCTIYEGNNSKLINYKNFYYNENTIGQDYSLITAMLGFHPIKHPGKITGLAAYGKYNQECISTVQKLLDFTWRRKTVKGYMTNHYYYCHTPKGLEELRKIRETNLGKFSREDISFAIQYLSERKTIKLIQDINDNFGYENIALSGGVFANVRINQKIKEMGFKNIFIQPAMGDNGLSYGAALLYASEKSNLNPYKLDDVYLGPAYSDEEIKNELNKFNLKYQKLDDIENQIAELLVKGKVIARFNGRMEFGPRALGNRSILYHAQDPNVNDWLNKNLKRSEFMPFAPVTLAEYASKCYKNLSGAEYAANFMTITFYCTEWMKQNCPAVVHVDGTARPQLISKKQNPSYYKILDEYRKITKIPVLVNTSFNMHEEPIVCSPNDAIRSFLQGNLDYLAIGDYLVKSKSRK